MSLWRSRRKNEGVVGAEICVVRGEYLFMRMRISVFIYGFKV